MEFTANVPCMAHALDGRDEIRLKDVKSGLILIYHISWEKVGYVQHVPPPDSLTHIANIIFHEFPFWTRGELCRNDVEADHEGLLDGAELVAGVGREFRVPTPGAVGFL